MDQGKILEVSSENVGARLAAGGLIGDDFIQVDDVSDFDEEGGTLLVDDVTYNYSGVDTELNRIILESILMEDHQNYDEQVFIYPLSEEKWATVDAPGNDDSLRVRVPHTLAATLEDGIREEFDQETVLIDYTEDDGWVIVDVIGRTTKLLGATVIPPEGGIHDGLPPAYAPAIATKSGIRSVVVQVEPISNPDPVFYEYHLSPVSIVPVAGDIATVVHLGPETQFFARTLPDGVTLLTPDATYYFYVFAKDVDGYGPVSAEATGTALQVTGPDIAADAVTAINILADTITADKFAATLAMVSAMLVGDNITIRPADSVPGINPPDNGLRVKLNNGGHVWIPTDGSEVDFDRVKARFTEIIVEDFLSILGVNNRVGGALTLDASVPPPSDMPAMVNLLDQAPITSTADSTCRGLGDDGVSWITAKHGVGAYNLQIIKINKTTGAKTNGPSLSSFIEFTLVSSHSNSTHFVAVLKCAGANAAADVYHTVVHNWSTGVTSIGSNTIGAPSAWWGPAVYTNGTNIWFAAVNRSTGKIKLISTAMNLTGASTVMAASTSTFGIDLNGLYVGNGDFGLAAAVVTSYYGNAVIDTTTNATMAETWMLSGEYVNSIGIIYDGTNFRTLHTDGKVLKHSTVKVDTARSGKYTWYNTVGNVESSDSPVNSFTQRARRWFRVTTSGIPASSDPASPDSARIYINAKRQAALGAGVATAIYEVEAAGAASPGTDGFAALGITGSIKSEADDVVGPLIDLKGDGAWRLGTMSGDKDGNLAQPAGGLTFANQAYTGTGFVRVTNTAAADVGHPLRSGMALASSGLQVPVDGWYHVYGSFAFGAGSAGTVARRGIAVSFSTVGVGGNDPQIVVQHPLNNSSNLTVSGLVKLDAGTGIFLWGYTDTANHYSTLSGGRLRAVLVG